MQERDIFLSALDIVDSQAREAHVQEKCAGDAALLARVKSLLASHEGPSLFLNTPAVAQMADSAGAGLDATMLHCDGATHDDEDEVGGPAGASEKIALGFLLPSKKADSLGRLGHYEILEVIGRGAFGTVLRAFDDKLQRVVAIKVLAPEMASTSPARKRFLREARTSAQIRHENVVAIYAVEDQPIPYLVMECIPGRTLQERLDAQGPLDLPNVLRLGKQVADGLAAAHAEGLIHRDIKPGNILLEGGMNDRVKITDFGLARTADDASMTQSGVIAGTPLYMAPEQALGHKLDQRADLFSLGSVLYQMISGRPPFRAPSTMAVLKRVVDDSPRPIQEIIPETPDWLCKLIGHLHAKNPNERYGSAQEVSDLLAQCLTDLQAGRTPTIPPPGKAVEKAPSVNRSQVTRREVLPLWKRPVAQIAAACVLLLGVGLGVAQFFRADEESTDGDNPQVTSRENQNFPPDSIAYKLTSDKYEWTKPEQVVIGDGPQMLITNPFVSADGQSLYFASPSSPAVGKDDIYVSQRDADGKSWGPPLPLPASINSEGPEGGPSVSADGKTLIFHSDRSGGEGDQDLWMATRDSLEESFGDVKNVGSVINGQKWDVDAELSVDGLTLAFTSDRGGKPDIWLSTRKAVSDPFGPPQSPGPAVNSPKLEIAPALAPDGTALLFASNRSGKCRLWMSLRASPDEPFGEARLLDVKMGDSDVVHSCLAVDGSELELYFTAKNEGGHLRLWRTRRVRKGQPPPPPPPYLRRESLTWPSNAPPLAIAPLTAEQAKQIQKTWADWLGLPVEKEVLLGRNSRGLDVKLSLVLIPPGEFLMGSSAEEIAKLREQAKARGIDMRQLDWIDLEGPQRKVRITRPFYMSENEFTTEQFRAFVEGAGDYQTEAEASGQGAWKAKAGVAERDPDLNWKRAGRLPQGPDSPVVNVTWNDANKCCQWLSLQEDGLTFTLPSEAQWEYACRAGTTTLWFTGDEESSLEGYAIYNTNWPQNVGARLPNAFGLCDMHGNVWEWCQDAFYNYRDADNVDPVGALEGERRIIRGGSCFGAFEFSNHWMEKSGGRSAVRYERLPDNPLLQVGFRVIAEIPEELLRIKSTPGARTYVSDEWIDVIPLIDPELDKWDHPSFAGKNEWRIDEGELLVGQADVKPHKLVFPLDGVWTAFDFEMDVTRRAGESGFCVNVPTSNGECPIAFDWPEGIRVGMGQNLRERLFRFGQAMKIGERTVLRFQVRRQNGTDVVSMWRDDKVIGTWEGDCSKFATGWQLVHPDTRRLSLFLPDGQREFVFHRIRIRTLDGGTATTLRPVSIGEPTDEPDAATP